MSTPFVFQPLSFPPDPPVRWECPDCPAIFEGPTSFVQMGATDHVAFLHTPAPLPTEEP